VGGHAASPLDQGRGHGRGGDLDAEVRDHGGDVPQRVELLQAAIDSSHRLGVTPRAGVAQLIAIRQHHRLEGAVAKECGVRLRVDAAASSGLRHLLRCAEGLHIEAIAVGPGPAWVGESRLGGGGGRQLSCHIRLPCLPDLPGWIGEVDPLGEHAPADQLPLGLPDGPFFGLRQLRQQGVYGGQPLRRRGRGSRGRFPGGVQPRSRPGARVAVCCGGRDPAAVGSPVEGAAQERAVGDAAENQAGSGQAGRVAEEPAAALRAGPADDALPVNVVAVLGNDLSALVVKSSLTGSWSEQLIAFPPAEQSSVPAVPWRRTGLVSWCRPPC
jgi:hypothetical protein